MSEKVSPKELMRAMRDLETQSHWQGYLKIAFALSALLGLAFVAMTAQSWLSYISFSIAGGVAYAYALIPTHDAIHYTLTGHKWSDEIYSRFISYPIFWTHGTYGQIHKIHHKMNGVDGKDPERKNPTKDEFFHENPLMRFYYRNRMLIDVFVFGGFGLIYLNIRDGIKFARTVKGVRRSVTIDFALMFTTHTFIISMLAGTGLLVKFYLMVLCWERVTGGILQYRAHIEHDSLEPAGGNYYEVQITSCRNVITSDWVSRYFNRLTYHSVHHTFPRIPYYNLKEAHDRLIRLIGEEHLHIESKSGYLAAGRYILNNPKYYELDEKGKITKTIRA